MYKGQAQNPHNQVIKKSSQKQSHTVLSRFTAFCCPAFIAIHTDWAACGLCNYTPLLVDNYYWVIFSNFKIRYLLFMPNHDLKSWARGLKTTFYNEHLVFIV